jgi:hypothetical protein
MQGQNCFKESDVVFSIEALGLMPVGELAFMQGNSAEYFLRVSLTAAGDLRLGADGRPGLVERGRLTKGGLVLINDYRPLFLGFFLRLGYV